MKNIELKLEENKKQQENILKTLDDAAKNVIKEIDIFLKKWIQEYVDNEVTKEQIEYSSKIGIEKLSALKAEIKGLIEDLDINNDFYQDKFWVHKGTIEKSSRPLFLDERLGGKEATLYYEVRIIIGKFVELLEKYGYFRSGVLPIKKIGYKAKYIGKIKFSENVLDSWEIYVENFNKLMNLMYTQDELLKENESVNIENIWRKL